MAADQLAVLLDRQEVAVLERDGEEIGLTYLPTIVRSAAGAPLISVSLPVREARYERAAILPYFDGVLPEGATRERLAARLRLDPADVFGLLREIGRDCAGALSVVPAGERDRADHEDVLWLDAKELARRVADLRDRPLADDPDSGIRISLAGVQDKMAVVARGSKLGLPRGLTPSTHILKPASIERRGARGDKLAYPALVANEAFCLELARAAGLATPGVEIIRVAGDPALVVERYDRLIESGRLARVHQEDFCQALGVPSRLKYEQQGGPGVRDYIALIDRWSTDVVTDRDELIDRVGFNYLIGNADAHAKNFSLLHGRGGIRLAPAYDLVSTAAYPQLDPRMATSVNGMFDASGLKPVHWRKWFEQIGLSERRYARRLAELADRVDKSRAAARAWIIERKIDDALLTSVERLVVARAKALRALL